MHADVRAQAQSLEFASTQFAGTVTTTSAEGSITPAADAPVRMRGSGKIDLTGANAQRLQGYGGTEQPSDAICQLEFSAPTGKVSLQTLNWTEALSRRFLT